MILIKEGQKRISNKWNGNIIWENISSMAQKPVICHIEKQESNLLSEIIICEK